MREVLGYRHDGKEWCTECVPLPLESLNARRLPNGTRAIVGVRGKPYGITCSRCGDDVGAPWFGKTTCACGAHAAAGSDAIQHQPREEESDMAKSKKTKGAKPRAAKAAKTLKSAPAERKREFKRDPRLPAVGSKITKIYKGKTLEIAVEADGLVLDGTKYASASALAKAATHAASINGMLWLGLATPKAKADPKRKPAKASA
jgi:hypothetical protein